MPDSQEPEVLFRPAPRFSDRQLYLILVLVALFLVSTLLLLARIPRSGEPAKTQEEMRVASLEEAAQRYGYRIHYKAPGDITGRTVITQGRGGFDLWGTAASEQKGVVTHIWGQVGATEQIAGSDDLTISIINPVEREQLGKIRIDRTRPSLPGGTNLEIFTTPVFLDVLAGPFEPQRIGYIGQWNKEEFGNVVNKGDFLGAGIALTWEDPVAKTGKLIPSRDEFGNFLVTGITIRRINENL